ASSSAPDDSDERLAARRPVRRWAPLEPVVAAHSSRPTAPSRALDLCELRLGAECLSRPSAPLEPIAPHSPALTAASSAADGCSDPSCRLRKRLGGLQGGTRRARRVSVNAYRQRAPPR